LVFTTGMMITDTLDGRMICIIDRRTDGQDAARHCRRVLGWLIVCISYGVASYNIGKALVPTIELGEKRFLAQWPCVGARDADCLGLVRRARVIRACHRPC
jgi:high-affinity nickel-transport protein